MKNEFSANEAMMDYNAKEHAMRIEWQRKLVAPVKRTERKPVAKQGFFSRFFKVV